MKIIFQLIIIHATSDSPVLECLCAISYVKYSIHLKGALSGLRKFLATESPLKMMKNTFYFTSKALSVLNIFKFLS